MSQRTGQCGLIGPAEAEEFDRSGNLRKLRSLNAGDELWTGFSTRGQSGSGDPEHAVILMQNPGADGVGYLFCRS